MHQLLTTGKISTLLLVFAIILSSCSGESTVYTLESEATPPEGGEVSPATGEYEDGTRVEVQATANEGWVFDSWQGDVSGADNPAVVTMDSDKIFTALFQPREYPLDITVDGGGTVEESIVEEKRKEYEPGTVVELNAVADEGWRFVEWQGDLNGSENPQQITVDDAKSVTAVFERRDYPLTINMDGEGNVQEEVIENPSKDYAYQTVVELTATPAEGWEFDRWEGDIEGSDNPQQITVDGEKAVTAVFERIGFDLNITVNGEGSVNEELIEEPSKSYASGSVVELTAEPADGWRFVSWEGDLSGDDNPQQITVDEEKNVTAIFERRDYPLNISTDGDGSVSEQVVESPAKDYAYQTVVELTATPAEGWDFARWEGDLTGSENPQQITVDGEKNVTAVFERNTFDLTIETTGQGSVNESVSKNPAKTSSYAFGTVVELTADPDDGWEFTEWQGDLSGSSNPEEITIDGNKNVIALFEEAEYSLEVIIEGAEFGSVDVDPEKDFYRFGDEVELTANPGELTAFKEWSGDISGSENPKTITVNGDLEITAIYGSRPSVETGDYSDMRVSSVNASGSVTDDGGFPVTERGICWSTDSFPNFSDNCIESGSGTGSFNEEITGLIQGSTYYINAYATNEAGTQFGGPVEFTAGYVSHGFINGVTPSDDNMYDNLSYKLVESEWKGGVGKIWIERNLGSTGAVKTVDDTNGYRAGWYFQFNRKQGYFHDGSTRVPSNSFEEVDENSDWDIDNDPCRAAFGGDWRIPTRQEVDDYYNAPASDDGASGGDIDDAFASLLRLHAAAFLTPNGNRSSLVGDLTAMWSSDENDNDQAYGLLISTSGGGVNNAYSKSSALPIRCVKD